MSLVWIDLDLRINGMCVNILVCHFYTAFLNFGFFIMLKEARHGRQLS